MTAIQIAMPVMFGLQPYVEAVEYDGEGYGKWAEEELLDPRWQEAVLYPWADEFEVDEICQECKNPTNECACLPF